MKVYRLHRKQLIPISLEDAWPYFATPRTLEPMTPSFLRFSIISEVPAEIYSGLVITYRIAAVAGIPMNWVTEIKHVDAPHHFVDEQRIGPFRFWYHQHCFRAVPGGTEMEDIVHYVMPWGWLGRLTHRLFIGKRLQAIFDFRRDYLARRWQTPPGMLRRKSAV